VTKDVFAFPGLLQFLDKKMQLARFFFVVWVPGDGTSIFKYESTVRYYLVLFGEEIENFCW
jgi:hypothetical protein